MDIAIRYSDGQIDIEGGEGALKRLSAGLRSAEEEVLIPLIRPSASPAPYNGYATTLRVKNSSNNVCISRQDNEVTIVGTREKRAILAQNIENLTDEDGRQGSEQNRIHAHFEYHEGHYYLTRESLPVVVTRYLKRR